MHPDQIFQRLEDGDSPENLRSLATAEWKRQRQRADSPHIVWGELFEELGMARLAIEAYGRAVPSSQAKGDLLFRLGVLYSELGEAERAIRHLNLAMENDPEDPLIRIELAKLHREFGNHLAAHRLEGRSSAQEAPLVKTAVTPSDVELRKLVHLFGCSDRMVYSARTADSLTLRWKELDVPLSVDLLKAHLAGTVHLGISPCRSDDTLLLLCVGIAVARRMCNLPRHTSPGFTMSSTRARELAVINARAMEKQGLPTLMADDGAGGYLLYSFFEEPLPRGIANSLLDALELSEPPPHSEVSMHSHQGKDEVWALPLGVSPLTGRRSELTSATGALEREPFAAIAAIPRARKVDVTRILCSTRRSSACLHVPANANKMLSQCAVLSAIVSDASRSGRLASDRRTVVCSTIGVKDDLGWLAALLGPDDRKKLAKYRKRSKAQHLMSCPKIRSLVPQLTSKLPCNCDFSACGPYDYPSPNLHVEQPALEVDLPASPFRIYERFQRLHTAYRAVECELRLWEEQLERLFVRCGVERIETPFGTIVRSIGSEVRFELFEGGE